MDRAAGSPNRATSASPPSASGCGCAPPEGISARGELHLALLCGAATLVGWLLELSGGLQVHRVGDWPAALAWTAFAIGYLAGSWVVAGDAVANLRRGRLRIESLMLLAALGAAWLGHPAEGGLLLFLFSLGHALEHLALGRARRSIAALGKMRPTTAVVRQGGEDRRLPVEQLRIGDTVVIGPDERIAADAVVVRGESWVDQAPVTGESVPVEKYPAAAPLLEQAAAAGADQRLPDVHVVYAGTVNGPGELIVRVWRRANDTTLDRVMRLVTEAQTLRSPTQRLTDAIERYYVPAVLALVAVLPLAFLVLEESFGESLYRAMAVLVGASPCALAISTPSAVLSAVARGGRGGVLIKGGGPLEMLGKVTTLAVDKTGTLTTGRPVLTDVMPIEAESEEELLRAAIGIELRSAHPLAHAIVTAGAERGIDPPSQVAVPRSVTGRGMMAEVDRRMTWVGRLRWFDELEGPPPPPSLRERVEQLESAGRTVMVVRQQDRYLGLLGVMDVPRREAAAAIERLREVGVRRLVLLSGDNPHVASAVARQVGISRAVGGLMPEDKTEQIRRLAKQGTVAMLGDGVNDAPALAAASVGIAMGAAGSEAALETADIALMSEDLGRLAFAFALARQASTVIRQNMIISLSMIAVLVPAALLGLRLGPVVVLHEGSTLVVVLNALRLLAFRDPFSQQPSPARSGTSVPLVEPPRGHGEPASDPAAPPPVGTEWPSALR